MGFFFAATNERAGNRERKKMEGRASQQETTKPYTGITGQR